MQSTSEGQRYRFERWILGEAPAIVAALAERRVAGRREGWTVAWYGNGQKACEGSFADDVEQGWWVFWSAEGVPLGFVDFRDGVPRLVVDTGQTLELPSPVRHRMAS